MKLSVKERIQLQFGEPSFLIKQGNALEVLTTKAILEKVSIDTKEADEIELKSAQVEGGSSLVWNTDKAKDKDIDFTDSELLQLKKGADALDKNKKLTDETISLYQKIIEYTKEEKKDDSQEQQTKGE